MCSAGLQSANGKLERDLSSRDAELNFMREQRTALEQAKEDLRNSLAKEHSQAVDAQEELAVLRVQLKDTEKEKQEAQTERDKLRGGEFGVGCLLGARVREVTGCVKSCGRGRPNEDESG